ncbi:glycine cleavage system aminomethyltransferase GcvT [Candidatus Aerophobetes bacterium]|nr:glycine cleavage system aminomethyltransferase GcvT [Candidatus Aerophobetes bacterium]
MKESQDYSNFLIEEDLSKIDLDIDLIIKFEEDRQAKKLILIPSESICPEAIRKVLGSVFTNLYAEGYPPLMMKSDEEKLLQDFKHQLTYYRRYSDRRFYKGADYVNLVEALAQRRAAECFATDNNPDAPIKVSADQIFVNVQPLSGAAANGAIYDAFVEIGDTVMGMALPHGGHLTHGSEFSRSGRYYHIVSYEVDKLTGKLNYEAIKRLAIKHKPKMIIAGYTSYPWAPDWQKFREIADEVGAILVADIAHPAGMVVAGVYPNPIGYADVITFTTHKTLCGPRGAVILTTDEEKAKKIDAAVFPGEQGGPHINKIAAMAVTFKIAQTEKFKKLQEKIVKNAKVLASSLEKRGLKLAYGGTNTHLLVIDLNAIKTKTGLPLKGEIAARILDLCGLVVNKNTIPGDETAADASGIRLGTPWVTQRGLGKEDMEKLAEVIYQVLINIQPFSYIGLTGDLSRGKIDLKVLEKARDEVNQLVQKAKDEVSPDKKELKFGYPHYTPPVRPSIKQTPLFTKHQKLGAKFSQDERWRMPLHYKNFEEELKAAKEGIALFDIGDMGLLKISGERAKPFLQETSTNDIGKLKPGHLLRSFLLNKDGKLIDDVLIFYLGLDERNIDHYLMETHSQNSEKVKLWLRELSDGYISFDEDDIFAKIEGPVVVEDLKETAEEKPRKTGIALYGPNSFKFLCRIESSLSSLKKSCFLEGEIKGIRGIVSRVDYAENISGFKFYIHLNDVSHLWDLFLEKGKDFGIKPAGLLVRDHLRSERKLPSYKDAESLVDGSFLQKMFPSYFHLPKRYFIGQKIISKAMGVSKVKKEEFQYKEKESKIRKTPLYEEHLKLTKRLVPFAGWMMPICYTSIDEEHRAVREAAGLFDVGHMGVIEISGEYAASFLDTVGTNYVRWIKPGESQYTYLLDPNGSVLDDVMIYYRGLNRYMMVCNAANEEKVWMWLNAVNSKRFLIDKDFPEKEIEGEAIIRNLKDASSGKDQRVDIALQGPTSLAILQKIAKNRELQKKLTRIKKNEFIEDELGGVKMLISRTGYTGEDIGYELYLHPDKVRLIWDLLLEEGKEFGIKPTALGARDSTRIEAGLPLYGHELAGKYCINPIEEGHGAFVKFHKPYFIGRKPLLESIVQRKMEIIRFKMVSRGIRMVRSGDPVVNEKGQYIGRVTSCALAEGIQLGLAFVDKNFTKEGTKIGIFILSRGRKATSEPSKDKLSLGNKVLLHEEGTILSRFQ